MKDETRKAFTELLESAKSLLEDAQDRGEDRDFDTGEEFTDWKRFAESLEAAQAAMDNE